jgi:glycosyltransferase involved in cell wall biosynthesis
MPSYQEEQGITILRCLRMHPNFLKRTELYADFLDTALRRLSSPPPIVHFRDIWSGIPLIAHPSLTKAKKIFEVNGLPSIELPVHYPLLHQNRSLLTYIRKMETICLTHADRIITVSRVTARHLEELGADRSKITVMPNMAEAAEEDGEAGIAQVDDLLRSGKKYALYAGTLSSWQGMEVLLKAFALLQTAPDLRLVVAASNAKNERETRKMIGRLGLVNDIILLCGIPHETVLKLYRKALLSAAPLTRCDRNEIQGCCPLKIVESMAAGTPVVASSLQVCRELIEHGKEGLLAMPDSARALAKGIQTLIQDEALRNRLGTAARARATREFSRKRFTQTLTEVYLSLSSAVEKTGSDYSPELMQAQSMEVRI